jgi:hypothetical protein
MRRSYAAVLVALTVTVSVLSVSASFAQSRFPQSLVPQSRFPMAADHDAGPVAEPADVAADAAFDRATDVLSGEAAAASSGASSGEASSGGAATDDGAATLALRDLFVSLPRLDPSRRQQARSLLARPTDGGSDPYNDGYTVPAKRDCASKICIHWVNSTADAPPDRQWVTKSLDVMKHVWAEEVGRLGYRAPVTDRQRGGNKKFDVYLKDVGSQGYYGYCVPERRKPGHTWVASGYCVLDDDFARSQFGARPTKSLRVTAAHEFFHAVQFAYDYAEDGWMMEATATWAEERVADDVNDNRQYLPYGQVNRPGTALDTYDKQGFTQYGNWVFFEYLSQRYGTGIVRKIWENATGKPRNYSTRAVKRSLPGDVTFTDIFRAYAADNTIPGQTYSEGAAWPAAKMAGQHKLSADAPAAGGSFKIDHMSSRNVLVNQDRTIRGKHWRLRLKVDGPSSGSGSAAFVLVHKTSGKVKRKLVTLDRDGRGEILVPFGSTTVKRVTLTLANASTDFSCWQQEMTYSCQGRPKDDNRTFEYHARALRN